jgi:hypothetical protein
LIHWEDLDGGAVEQAARLLLCRLYPDTESIDGSGGDGDRDLVRRTTSGLVIYEVKKFPRRLTTKQKHQIKKSLNKALDHDPIQWHLVLPLDHSPNPDF